MKRKPVVHLLTRLDNREIPSDTSEIRVFSVVQNEMVRIPYFLEYYRKQGADRFFFIDNKSTDGSREFLLQQPDCHLFYTDNLYGEATSGIVWSNGLLNIYGVDHWCLVADADEILVYPHSEKVSLRQLCAFMDSEGSEILFTFLLDMYPKSRMAEAVCEKGKPFHEIAPYFDKDYAFVDRIHMRGEKPFPPQEVLGGPRARCFFPDQGENSYFRRLFIHIVERITYQLRRRGIPVPIIKLKAPALFKVPLVKWRKGNAYIASTHVIKAKKLASISGVILHFKFFSDFHERVVAALNHKQHTDGSAEYKMYMKHMEKTGNFIYEGSRAYTSSHDVLECGLIKTNDLYERYVASLRQITAA